MAESKLREQLYVIYGTSGLTHQRVELEKKIRSMAKRSIMTQIEDDTDKDIIFSVIDETNLDLIFVIH